MMSFLLGPPTLTQEGAEGAQGVGSGELLVALKEINHKALPSQSPWE